MHLHAAINATYFHPQRMLNITVSNLETDKGLNDLDWKHSTTSAPALWQQPVKKATQNVFWLFVQQCFISTVKAHKVVSVWKHLDQI